jgi:hypothetical protein
LWIVDLNRLEYQRLAYIFHRERRHISPPVARVEPFLIKTSKEQQTDERHPPLRRWYPRPRVNEHWQSTSASLPSGPEMPQSDVATNVHAINIVEAHSLVDMFVSGEELPADVTVERRRSDIFQIYYTGREYIVIID